MYLYLAQSRWDSKPCCNYRNPHILPSSSRAMSQLFNGVNRPFPRSMRSQGKRPGRGSRQACRPRRCCGRMTLRLKTLTGHYFILKFDLSWGIRTNMGKPVGIFLNLQCDCHSVASIFIKLTNQRTNFITWLPDLTALGIDGVSLNSQAHIFSILHTHTHTHTHTGLINKSP